MFNFIKNLGTGEIIIIGVIVAVFFGSKKIVELGKTAGETTKEIKKINKEYKETVKNLNKDEINETEVQKKINA